VPFGQDRIVPISLATLAAAAEEPDHSIQNSNRMLETFGMHKRGKEYRRLVAAFERIFGARMFFGTDSVSAKAKVVQCRRFKSPVRGPDLVQPPVGATFIGRGFENVIVLSDEFYRRSRRTRYQRTWKR